MSRNISAKSRPYVSRRAFVCDMRGICKYYFQKISEKFACLQKKSALTYGSGRAQGFSRGRGAVMRHSSGFTSTRTMSGPMRRMQFQGIR